MLYIKRLHRYALLSFIPVFMMTFTICLFIVLMQFLWKNIEEFVGKGLDLAILGEMFFYAALALIPMALPLAILLAALMMFGNMGKKLELLAIKASGVSLLRMMKPLIVLIIFISIGAFFFQNDAMPRINVKMQTLLNSIKQKALELDIPEGAFYEIGGSKNISYNVFVKTKNPETGMLYGFMLYDTKDYEKISVMVADSAKMMMSEDKTFFQLTMYDGQQFTKQSESNTKTNTSRSERRRNGTNTNHSRYTKENFKMKRIIVSFDGNFNRVDESYMEMSQKAKNLTDLTYSIDSMQIRLDTLDTKDLMSLNESYFGPFGREMEITENVPVLPFADDALKRKEKEDRKSRITEENKNLIMDIDSLLATLRLSEKVQAWDRAANQSQLIKSNMDTYQSTGLKNDLNKSIRRHNVEWHQKFTLSFACIIFFFIGAPLGAIIRKGGLGMPVVVSVILFIIYYIINNIGIKMARDGVWPEWEGVWLSSVVLFPLGVFLTYKSMKDSDLFNAEAYGKIFRKLLRISSKVNNDDILVDIRNIPDIVNLNPDPEILSNFRERSNDQLKDIAQNYEHYGYDQENQIIALSLLKERGDTLIDTRIYIKNYEMAEKEYNNFKQSSRLTLPQYIFTLLLLILSMIWGHWLVQWLLIISVAVYAISFIRSITYYTNYCKYLLKKATTKSNALLALGALLYAWLYPYLVKQMDNELKKKR